jgi:choline dehydrogenase-like flavoprotein
MVFDRGSKSDYDSWAALGNEGWDWDGLLPYFKKVFSPFVLVSFDALGQSGI